MNEVLNEELLNELKLIMEDEFSDLMQTFLVESEKQFLSAQSAWDGGDFPKLRLSAHSLKGSCANVGAEQLQQTCALLENQALAGNGDHVPELLARVSTQLNDVHDVIEQL
ncbi:MAG: Hpt domain-containing protein [Pseudomonadaceae bacterium]|nr:Hpt domain-containing protein [Pseudomonadaceae bacterium]